MQCPNCELINPATAQRCDCGYDFTKGLVVRSPEARHETTRELSPIGWFLEPWKKYSVLEGRARRKEYWYFVLFNILVALTIGVIDGLVGGADVDQGLFGIIYSMAALMPGITVGVRRMHDTNHSGWWILLPIANVVLAATEGQAGSNRFGPDPTNAPPAMMEDGERLTNNEILAMVSVGLADSVIVSKIRQSRSEFSLSSSDLITLRKRGVSDSIIVAMLESQESRR